MSVTSNRSVVVQMTGDIEYTQQFDATPNPTGSGQVELISLTTGNNTIIPPTDAFAVTILPPLGNTSVLTIKGTNSDTGIVISLDNPSSIGLGDGNSFVLNASAPADIRFIWS